MRNALPFHWAGYRLEVRYTYRLEGLGSEEALWQGLNGNIRREIRKARKRVEVRDDLGLDRFYDVYAKTFARQGLELPDPFATTRAPRRRLRAARRADDAVRARRRRAVHAVPTSCGTAAPPTTCSGGGDPELRTSGASSLLMWEAIMRARAVSDVFDFEGSMLQPVERFFRAFGGRQTPVPVREPDEPRGPRRPGARGRGGATSVPSHGHAQGGGVRKHDGETRDGTEAVPGAGSNGGRENGSADLGAARGRRGGAVSIAAAPVTPRRAPPAAPRPEPGSSSEDEGDAPEFRSTPIATSSAEALVFRCLQTVALVLLVIVTGRLMEPEGRGLFALASLAVTLCGIPLGGVWLANGVELARARAMPRELLGASVVIAAVGGIATGLIALAIAPLLGDRWWLIALPAAVTPFQLLGTYLQGLYTALGHIRAVNIIALGRAILPLLFITPPLLAGASSRAAIAIWTLRSPPRRSSPSSRCAPCSAAGPPARPPSVPARRQRTA